MSNRLLPSIIKPYNKDQCHSSSVGPTSLTNHSTDNLMSNDHPYHCFILKVDHRQLSKPQLTDKSKERNRILMSLKHLPEEAHGGNATKQPNTTILLDELKEMTRIPWTSNGMPTHSDLSCQ
jgi:hypothetical protein